MLSTPAELPCPQCAASVRLDMSLSRTAVCTYCRSTVVFGDDSARIVGTLSMLPSGRSALAVGSMGSVLERQFEVLGRVRYDWDRGFWDEWYIVLNDGRSGWLSDEDGELTWEGQGAGVDAGDAAQFRARFRAGAEVELAGRRWRVTEVGDAACAGGEGQLPFALSEGERMGFADLADAKGQVATVEFHADETALLFQGRVIPPGSLRIDRGRESFDSDIPVARRSSLSGVEFVTAASSGVRTLACRSCGGSLEVDSAKGLPPAVRCPFCQSVERLGATEVTCPSCAQPIPIAAGDESALGTCPNCLSRVDIRQNRTVSAAPQGKRPASALSVGEPVTLDGVEFRITGWLRYEGRDSEESWHWDEYLLFAPESGYAWLELESGHARLLRRLSSGPSVSVVSGAPDRLSFGGRTWKRTEAPSTGRIAWVEGELPWVAMAGDKSTSVDYVAPPLGLSAEWTRNEVEWFGARYVPPDELRKAVRGASRLPKPEGVSASQPYSDRLVGAMRWCLAAAAASAILLGVSFGFGEQLALESIDAAIGRDEPLALGPFSFRDGDLVELDLDTELSNAWLGVQIAIVDGSTEALFGSVVLGASYYEGVEQGESWSEGSRSDSTTFRFAGSAESVRVYVSAEAGSGASAAPLPPGSVINARLRVTRGVWLQRYFIGALVVFGLIGVGLWLHRRIFRGLRDSGMTLAELVTDSD